MGWANTEKKALVDTLRRADPERDTLCPGWSTASSPDRPAGRR